METEGPPSGASVSVNCALWDSTLPIATENCLEHGKIADIPSVTTPLNNCGGIRTITSEVKHNVMIRITLYNYSKREECIR